MADGDAAENEEEIILPALRRMVSRSEMFEEHLKQHPDKKGLLDRSAFHGIATRLTRMQQKSMRALDYNITDLLLEPAIISDLGGESEDATALLKDLELVYSTVQHLYPKLVDTTTNAPHNIRFGVGDSSATPGGGSCSVCSTVIRFFEDRLPSSFGGRLGAEYDDIVKWSLEKVILYMGHIVRCAAQQKQIKALQDAESGVVAIVTIDYMMKYGETRAREAGREHYGKRGLVVHGAMVTYKKDDGSVVKRICITAPEGDGTQYAAAALAMVDVICLKVIKEDHEFAGVTDIVVLSNNAATYSADVFSVGVFDIAQSHGLRVSAIIDNEAQDGKTELDS